MVRKRDGSERRAFFPHTGVIPPAPLGFNCERKREMYGDDFVFPSGVQPDNYREPGYAFESGIRVRDYIAIKAMEAIIAHPGIEPDDASRTGVAQLAYEFADAMLAVSATTLEK